MTDLQTAPMPSGWDCRFDRKSGRYYFINHQTKTTTWDDPRLSRTRHVEFIPLQDLSQTVRSSPKPSHSQESTLTAAVNTEEAVTKISAMFPTVSDTHIRLLLKKYMKSIFPKAEEMLILDLLTSNDNNIQKVSDVLKDMGFERRDSVPKVKPAPPEPEKAAEEPELTTVVIQVLKSLEEKKQLVSQLHEKYKDIPEQVVTIALESVEYDENRAHQILNIMLQEESCKDSNDESEDSTDATSQTTSTVPQSQSRQSLKSLLKTDKSDHSLKDACSFSRVIESEETNGMGDDGYRSPHITSTQGANRNIVKGANHDLLLEDYVKWQGPQPGFQHGPKSLAKGPNSSLLSSRTYQACGPNSGLAKGPKLGLAKGSLFSQFKGVVNGSEVRGK